MFCADFLCLLNQLDTLKKTQHHLYGHGLAEYWGEARLQLTQIIYFHLINSNVLHTGRNNFKHENYRILSYFHLNSGAHTQLFIFREVHTFKWNMVLLELWCLLCAMVQGCDEKAVEWRWALWKCSFSCDIMKND